MNRLCRKLKAASNESYQHFSFSEKLSQLLLFQDIHVSNINATSPPPPGDIIFLFPSCIRGDINALALEGDIKAPRFLRTESG
jgi:hypothetical protein